MAHTFGQFFKQCREKTAMGLREFCVEHGFDPGNISKLERGRMAPPQTKEKLSIYASALGLAEGNEDWQTFHDLAAAEAGRVPEDLMSDEAVVAKLPLLFRTIRNERLDRLIDAIRRA